MGMSKKAVAASLSVFAALGLVIGCTSMQMAEDGAERAPAGKKDKAEKGEKDEKSDKSSLNGMWIRPIGQKINTHFVDVNDVQALCGADLTKPDNGRDPVQRSLDLNNPSDQIWLRAEREKLFALADKQKAAEETGQQRRQCRVTKGMKKALNEMAKLMPVAFDGKGDEASQMAARQHLAVLADVVSNQFRYPVPKKMDVLEAPVILADRETNLVGEGNRGPVRNIGTNRSDDGKLDPKGGSTLWTRQNDIPKKELYFGFGRSSLPLAKDDICKYKGPKSGYGIHGGFDAKCNDREFKIRFGSEVYTGAFNTRIFSALGFNVPAFDHVEDLKIKFDKKLFTEYNKRAEMGFDLTLGWVIKITNFEIQRYVDPIEMVKEVVMKSGERIAASDLKKRMFHRPEQPKPELDESNWKDEINEKTVEYIVLAPATANQKNEDIDEIGGFDWNEVDYTYRREFRGLGVLAAWVGWYDSRFDNTKLVFEKNGGIKHYVTDLGSGLGQTSTVINLTNAEANDFSWGLVDYRDVPRKDSADVYGGAKPDNIGIFREFGALDFNRPFMAANTDDTKWMVRQIAQLTREQIKAALVATGLSAAEVRMLLEKLCYRRDAMVRVYGLTGEFAQISKFGEPTNFDFDPRDPKEEKMSVTVNGVTYLAPDQGYQVVSGVVCARDKMVGRKCTSPKNRGAMKASVAQ